MTYASQHRVRMEEIAIIPSMDSHAAARMITFGTTANVSIIVIKYTLSIYFNKLMLMLNLA